MPHKERALPLLRGRDYPPPAIKKAVELFRRRGKQRGPHRLSSSKIGKVCGARSASTVRTWYMKYKQGTLQSLRRGLISLARSMFAKCINKFHVSRLGKKYRLSPVHAEGIAPVTLSDAKKAEAVAFL